VKAFIETLRVTNPIRQSRASSREASLAWGRVTVTAKRSLIHGSRPEPVGTNRGRNDGNRQTKETKCGETDGKESECPIVASKRGNGPYRTPGSEGGAALWTRRRNHAEDTVPHPRVTRSRRIV
jgi:hypothetical protein